MPDGPNAFAERNPCGLGSNTLKRAQHPGEHVEFVYFGCSFSAAELMQ